MCNELGKQSGTSSPGRPHSLRTALAWLLAAVLIPLVTTGATLVAYQWSNEREGAFAVLRDEAQALRNALDRELALDQAVLTALAASKDIDRGDWAAFHAQARQASQVRPGSWLLLVDRDAQTIVNTAVPYGTPLPNFRLAAESTKEIDWSGRKLPMPDGGVLLRALQQRKPQFTGLIYGPVVRRPVVGNAVPVERGGTPLYGLGLTYSTEFIQRIVETNADGRVVKAVIDGSGLIIARHPDAERFVGLRALAPFDRGTAPLLAEGIGETIGIDGTRRVFAYSRSNVNDWVVVAGMPTSAVVAPAWRAVGLSVAVLLMVAAIGTFFAVRLWRRLAGPLAALAREAGSLGDRPFDVPPTGIAEIDTLRHSLLEAGRYLAERRQAEAARDRYARQLQIAFDAATMGWWQYDPTAGRVSLDDGARRILGVSAAEPTDDEWLGLVHPDDRALVQSLTAAALDPAKDGRYAAEYRIHREDSGEACWVEAHGLTTFSGDGPGRRATGLVGMIVDITQRKRAEEALRESKARLEEADRRKSEFLSMLSHELRNPLAAISNIAALLSRGLSPASRAPALHEMLQRQTRHLARMVDDLIDVAHITRGTVRMRREAIRLDELVHEAAADARPTMEAKAHRFKVDAADALWIHGDAARLKQVLGNLLENAAKYTDPGGEIALRLVRSASAAAIVVDDNGAGIDEALRPHVFELFTQGPRTLDRSEGGLGIGLTVVKTIAEMHGGTVEIESRAGGGTRFTVRLPLAPAEVPAPVERTPSATAGSLRILVVEDNVDAAESLAALLRLAGHHVELAHDGAEGLAAANRQQPDAIVLDIGLPTMSGHEVGRVIRAEEWGRHVPIIALTGWGQEDDHLKSREAGFDAHFVKPVEPDALLALLARLAQGAVLR
ncbi:MAG TPA: ATP-binding protein [Burkholderiaceae bacterium]|nr:ATP-binding protein [Burkholderiaceae bacterium]